MRTIVLNPYLTRLHLLSSSASILPCEWHIPAFKHPWHQSHKRTHRLNPVSVSITIAPAREFALTGATRTRSKSSRRTQPQPGTSSQLMRAPHLSVLHFPSSSSSAIPFLKLIQLHLAHRCSPSQNLEHPDCKFRARECLHQIRPRSERRSRSRGRSRHCMRLRNSPVVVSGGCRLFGWWCAVVLGPFWMIWVFQLRSLGWEDGVVEGRFRLSK